LKNLEAIRSWNFAGITMDTASSFASTELEN
jgi:hypothetical protein